MSQLPIPGGHTYSDDYTTDRDMNDGGHRIWMMPMIAEFLAHLVSVLATTASDVSATAGSATAAAGSAVAAAGSATTASNKADAANTSAQNALTSEQHAKTSEDNAKASETAAGNTLTTINGYRTEISGWRTDVSGWRAEISGWRTEISGWRTDVSGWRTEVSNNASTVNADKGIIAQYKTDTYNYMVAAQTASTNAQTWDPTNYVRKVSMTSYTFQTIDLDTLNTVGETKYLDATNSPHAPAGGAGYGYYVGLAGGDAGGNLGLQMFVTQNDRMFVRDKYNGNWRELWHSGRLPITVAGNVVDFPVAPTVAGLPMGGGSGSVSLTRHFLSM